MDVDLGQLKQPCACGEEHAADTEEVHIGSGVVKELDDVLREHQNPVFICDSNTRAAAEPFLEEEFKDCLVIELNPEGLAADRESLDKVLSQLEVCDLGQSSVSVDMLVAIGAGTIHDLTGIAAQEYGIPYASVPTAASTDAYTSAPALQTREGGGEAIVSGAPLWVFADTDIFRTAPKVLLEKGVCLLQERKEALQRADQTEEDAAAKPCETLRQYVERVLNDAERSADHAPDGDVQALEDIMGALLVCGLVKKDLRV